MPLCSESFGQYRQRIRYVPCICSLSIQVFDKQATRKWLNGTRGHLTTMSENGEVCLPRSRMMALCYNRTCLRQLSVIALEQPKTHALTGCFLRQSEPRESTADRFAQHRHPNKATFPISLLRQPQRLPGIDLVCVAVRNSPQGSRLGENMRSTAL